MTVVLTFGRKRAMRLLLGCGSCVGFQEPAFPICSEMIGIPGSGYWVRGSWQLDVRALTADYSPSFTKNGMVCAWTKHGPVRSQS